MQKTLETLFQLRLAQTREYDPRALEHWLHRVQHQRAPWTVQLKTIDHKVQWFSSVDWSPWLPGARALVASQTPSGQMRPLVQRSSSKFSRKNSPRVFYLTHSKSPLLPCKRYSQFEDPVHKTRIIPTEDLIRELHKHPHAEFEIKAQSFPEKSREKLLKKARQPWFNIERRFDQWESRGWLKWSWRRLFGPLLRISFQSQKHLKNTDEKIQSKHEREAAMDALLDKLARPLFTVTIKSTVRIDSFAHAFELPYLGGLHSTTKPSSLLLSAEELASLLALPNAKNVANELESESSAYLPCPLKNPLAWEAEDRKRHLYLVGKTGMGKSTLLLHLLKQDLDQENALIVLDPHGDLVEDALALISEKQSARVLHLDPSDADFPLALNPLEAQSELSSALQASALVDMFACLAQGSWGPRLEYILRNALLLLIESPNTTLLDLPQLLTNPSVVHEKLRTCQNPEVHRFFEDEFLTWDEKTRSEYTAPILNKVGPLLSTPLLRNIFAQPKGKVRMEELLSQNKILLITLSKGKMGEDASRLLGMIFLAMIQAALLRRAALPSSQRHFLPVFIDEFQNFTTKTLMSMLSELRKYGLALTLANQYLTQNPPEIQEAVLGNVGSLFCFRTSYADAQILAPSLGLAEEDLNQLAPFQAYVRRLHKNAITPLFRLDLPPLSQTQKTANKTKLLTRSRAQLARPRKQVEEKTLIWYNKRRQNFHAKAT